MIEVAALYIDTARGPYVGRPGVVCWGQATRDGAQVDLFAPGNRDARDYNGPHRVICHPPCGPWGKFWWNYKGGEGDKSCAPRGIEQVRQFGGVLEHPSGSRLWPALDLPRPGDDPDGFGGFTIEINQCDWGHPAKKPTWLYIVGGTPPPMPPSGTPTMVMVRLLRNHCQLPEVPKRIRHLTTPAMARWLVALARSTTR